MLNNDDHRSATHHFRPSQRLMMRDRVCFIVCVDRACVNVYSILFLDARDCKKKNCETKQENITHLVPILYILFAAF